MLVAPQSSGSQAKEAPPLATTGVKPATTAAPSIVSPALVFALLLGAFFLSGASALIYEIVWTRLLSLMFGVTIHAVSVVLACFMGGLALGSILAGRFADRVGRPLRFYGALELLIGLLGAASPVAIKALTPAYVWLYSATGDSLVLATALRLALASALLLLPTCLMGATLPFMVRACLHRLPRLGENFSMLYALNTAGAAAGTLVAGFFLIGALGFQGSAYVAVLLNLGAAGVAVFVSSLLERTPVESPMELREASCPEPAGERASAAKAVLLGIGVSGFCALAYEVVWFRVLDLFFNGTAYAFSLMLFTFLVGLAIGSAISRAFIGRPWNWLVTLGMLEVLIGLEAVAGQRLIGHVPGARDALAAIPLAGALLQRPVFTMAAVGVLVLLPLTVLLGMTFPVAAQAMAQGQREVGKLVGRMSAANTMGAILGSLAGGFWLLPNLGSHRSLAMLATANVVLGLGLLWWAVRGRVWFARAAIPLSAVLLLYPAGAQDLLPEVFTGLFRNHRLLWYEEGVENTVSILEDPQGFTMLYLNSREQASDSPDMVTFHRFLGHLPMLLHPDPEEVLVIGLGGGATPGAISQYEGSNLDIVELSPSVIRAARHFASVNNRVVEQPNARVIVDDGRNHLLLGKKKYDVITADLIQPFHAGSGNLYSQEYFRLAREALAEDGIMVQWANRLSNVYPLITRTFLQEFPYVTAWSQGAILIGSKQPQALSVEALQRRFEQGNVREIARQAGITGPEQLMRAAFHEDGQQLRQRIGPGPILTDDLPLTEYFRGTPAVEPKLPAKP